MATEVSSSVRQSSLFVTLTGSIVFLALSAFEGNIDCTNYHRAMPDAPAEKQTCEPDVSFAVEETCG